MWKQIICIVTLFVFVFGQFPSSWNLAWSDEFDGASLNQDNWQYNIGNNNGWGNHELEFYTDRPENSYLQDGNLVIAARQEEFQGFSYTSARIISQDKKSFLFPEGTALAARIKTPFGQGVWPAFWAMGQQIETVGWPSCGEIDIMEKAGGEHPFPAGDSQNLQTIHFNADSTYQRNEHAMIGNAFRNPTPFNEDFHIFWSVWNSTFMFMGIDTDVHFAHNIADIPTFQQSPFFILMNIAVGGDFPGPPSNSTVFPQFMFIDYVRVFSTPQDIPVNFPTSA